MLLYSLPETWGAFDLSELPGGRNAIWSQVRARDRNAVLEVATHPRRRRPVLQVGKTSEARNQLLSNFRRVLMLGAGAALLIGVIGGLFLTRSTLKPLRDLRDAVRRILHTGQTDDRVPVYGTDDAVDELSDLFNAMLARITTLIHGMRNALDHVAHDLRTPMTRLRVTAESALATNDPAQASRGVVGLSRGIRARAVDADDADGYFGGRDRHDEAERVAGRRSRSSRRRCAISTKTRAEDAGVTLRRRMCRPTSS